MAFQVKEVTVCDTPGKGAAKPRRYMVCRNPDQARKDAATRAQILAALEAKLRSHGPKSVVANKGYKRYLKAEKGAFAIDLDKARDEERFDGMWVLRTNTELSAVEVALRYKQLWMVEQVFRTAKSLLDTRPVFHKTDATICGHVFCSFLALVLRDELFRRMDNAGVNAEWADILRDLNALTETTIAYNGKTFVVRSNAVGVAGKIAQCVGVRLPNTVRQLAIEEGKRRPRPLGPVDDGGADAQRRHQRLLGFPGESVARRINTTTSVLMPMIAIDARSSILEVRSSPSPVATGGCICVSYWMVHG